MPGREKTIAAIGVGDLGVGGRDSAADDRRTRVVSRDEMRIDLERLVEVLDDFVVAPGANERPPDREVVEKVDRVEL